MSVLGFVFAALVVALLVIAVYAYMSKSEGFYGRRGRYGVGLVPYGRRYHPWGRLTYGYPVYPGRYTYGGYAYAPYGGYNTEYGPFYRPYRPYYLPHASA